MPRLLAEGHKLLAVGAVPDTKKTVLTAADEILMNAEHAPVSPSDVNALFRVFHTIKGVAGFLDLDEIGSLAHITETLLGNARDGSYVIDTLGVDALISAVATVRKLLSLIAQAVKAGTTVRRYAGLKETIARIELLTRISTTPLSLEVSGAPGKFAGTFDLGAESRYLGVIKLA